MAFFFFNVVYSSIVVVYQSPGVRVTGDLFVSSTISWDRKEHRGAGYRLIPEVLQQLLPVDPSAHAFDLEFLIFEVYSFTHYPT
jgi:hypothetical protein